MKKRRIFAAVLCVSMLFSACAAPGESSAGSESSKNPSQVSSADSGTAATPDTQQTGYFKKYDPPITLTTHAIQSTTMLFQDNDNIEDNGWTRWQKEHYGIEWKIAWTAPDAAADQQKLDLAFASGDLPDVIMPTATQLSKYVKAGLVQPIDGLLETYASPLVKWGVEDAVEQTQGAFFLPATIDGAVYAMPVMSDTIVFWNNAFTRVDILKELGMEMPETLAELETVYEAYKAKYPSLYPFAMDNELAAFQVVASAYQAAKGSWVQLENGEIGYGSIQPEARDTLEKMAQWYQKGYIDPEFVVKSGEKMREDIIAGNFMTYYGSWASIASPFTPMWNNLPDADPEIMPFLEGDTGETAVYAKTWFQSLRAVTTNCENPEALIYAMNENWDSYYRNDLEIRELMETEYDYSFKYPQTQEQQPYNLEDVSRDYPQAAQPRDMWKYEYAPEDEGCGFINNYYTHYSRLFGFTGSPVTVLNRDLKSMAETVREDDESLLTVDGRVMYDEWSNSHPNMLTNWSVTEKYWSEFEKSGNYIADVYAGAPTELMSEKKAYLDKLELEAYTKIIMGTESIEAFDKFVEDWNNNGGADITKEVNEWYQSNQ